MLFIDSRKGTRNVCLCPYRDWLPVNGPFNQDPDKAGGRHRFRTKILLVMRWTAVLMLAFCLQVSARGFSQQISLTVENAPLKKVLLELQKQTGYYFLCDEELLAQSDLVSINMKNSPLDKVLDRCFPSNNYTWSLIEKTIVIRKKEAPARTAPVPVQQDTTVIITGRVLTDRGEPMIGTTIKLKGTTIGTTTNEGGEYALKVPGGKGILVATSIGYTPKEMVIGGRTVDFTLLEDDKELGEVVVVAYGQKQRKIATLGAQSSLNVDELKQPVANISTVLAGRVSGLVGVQRSAEPGLDNADLWVRGIATLSNSANNGSPLILVDGVERSFQNLDPNDIESFTILKDASSTSVYGVRGANGVILITTKRGKAGRTRINVDFYQGITNFTRVPEVADGVTYLQMANEASVTRGGLPIYSEEIINKTYTQEDPLLYPNVNWFDEIFNKFGNNRKANLNITGGSDKATYYVSAGFYDETGLFKTDDLQKYNSEISFKRYNFTSSLSMKATKTTDINLNIKGWISNGNYPGTGTQDIFRSVFTTYPTIYPLQYPGNLEPFVSTGGGMNNPYALLTNRGYTTTYENQLNSDISVRQGLDFITKGLSARALYSFDARNSNRLRRTRERPITYYATGRDADGELILERTDGGNGVDYLSFSREAGGDRQFYFEGAVNYDRAFGRHNVSGILLYNQSDKISATAGDLIGSLPYRSLGAVARASYSFADRYLAEVSFGYNGAENFAPDRRFGFFPSVAVGWVVSNELFYDRLKDAVQFLKLRASYGVVGNSRIDGRRFAYVGTTEASGEFWFGRDRDNNIKGIDILDYPASVTWETSKDLNLGLEFRTLNNNLYIQADYFNRERTNIFLQRASVPAIIGLRRNLLGNLGAASSSGIDVSADYDANLGPVSIQLRGTFTYNENKVVENDEPVQPYPWLEKRGKPAFQRYGYIAEGFYTQAEIDDPKVPRTTGVVQAGDLKFKDLNGDGIIDGNDVAPIGRNSVPQIIYGFGTTLGYKGFSLAAFFQGAGLVDFYVGDGDFLPFRHGSAKGSLYANIKDRWTEDNPRQDAFYPRLSYGADLNQNYATNSHWVMKGDFLRLKTLDFGYTLPAGSLKRFGVQKMRIYFIGYNLLTFSPFKLYDPEMGSGTGTRYPNIKTFSLGFNVSF